jgi:hypothetical protein
MKKIIPLSLLLLLGLSPLCYAQPVANEIHSWPLAIQYDVQSGAYIYCRTEGVARVGNDDNRRVTTAPITAAANSTTLAAVTAGTNPFANLVVGDVIYLQDPFQATKGATLEKVITARASADSVTISSVISVPTAFTANSFEWRKRQCATTANAGWFPVEGYRPVKFSVGANTIGATSVDIRFECREQGEDNQPYPVCTSGVCSSAGVLTVPAASAGFSGRNAFVVGVNDQWKECRVGLKINGAGTQSITMRATTSR